MKELNIVGTVSTPTVVGDWEAGVLKMSGDSYPENSFELFGPVIQWVEAYLGENPGALKLELSLLYLNTSSVKAVMEIFDTLESAFLSGRDVSVTWYFEESNERVGELAEEFKEDCSFPFDVVGRP